MKPPRIRTGKAKPPGKKVPKAAAKPTRAQITRGNALALAMAGKR